MIHRSLLMYRGARYFWWALFLTVGSTVLYVTQGDTQPPNGGTWQGYVLGTIGALLIVWLALLGVRKRRYSSTVGTVQGWTSAHVYLGSALILVATRSGTKRPAIIAIWLYQAPVTTLAFPARVASTAWRATSRGSSWGPRATNFFVAYPPFVWLPAVMVLAALAGHLLIFRALFTRPA